MLQGWDDHSIRIKAAKLLGCQNLSCYYGRRFSRAEVQAEFEKNRQLGAATGCWKNGMLVDDDQGTLKAHFAAKQQQQQQELLEGVPGQAIALPVGAAEVTAGSIQNPTGSAGAAANAEVSLDQHPAAAGEGTVGMLATEEPS
jgi:hypothetical protein